MFILAATLFLELWKRYSAEITHRWDLTGFDIHEEHPRPQYLARLAHITRVRINYITNTKEPNPPFWRMKLPAAVFSFSVVILLITLAVVAVVSVVLYRMSLLAALSVQDVTTSNAIWLTTITAAFINLVLIVIFNYFYTLLAEWLTEFEILRTQTEFDDSLTLKIYLLQFVNYYASIFYIAFFKGKFIGYPGNYNRFFNYRQEEVLRSRFLITNIWNWEAKINALFIGSLSVWFGWVPNGALHPTCYYYGGQTGDEHNSGDAIAHIL